MEWIRRMNQAVSYIEDHLTEEIRYEELGRTACCSAYHFQRMFGYMAGFRSRNISAQTDVPGRRGSDEREKIIDVALKYGYSSPTAFNGPFRAFTERLRPR